MSKPLLCCRPLIWIAAIGLVGPATARADDSPSPDAAAPSPAPAGAVRDPDPAAHTASRDVTADPAGGPRDVTAPAPPLSVFAAVGIELRPVALERVILAGTLDAAGVSEPFQVDGGRVGGGYQAGLGVQVGLLTSRLYGGLHLTLGSFKGQREVRERTQFLEATVASGVASTSGSLGAFCGATANVGAWGFRAGVEGGFNLIRVPATARRGVSEPVANFLDGGSWYVMPHVAATYSSPHGSVIAQIGTDTEAPGNIDVAILWVASYPGRAR